MATRFESEMKNDYKKIIRSAINPAISNRVSKRAVNNMIITASFAECITMYFLEYKNEAFKVMEDLNLEDIFDSKSLSGLSRTQRRDMERVLEDEKKHLKQSLNYFTEKFNVLADTICSVDNANMGVIGEIQDKLHSVVKDLI